ncbi:hypothetical protein BpHYR1_033229 [Brachionus plicatilis]|uniref:Uncharacterized protein n=1 Tax=Brachionus plicatilis TaxID=10195 RepID=A0A3M7PBS8_BRAPC|nr:hypothetical protein BpHYR1_033229 [Brachionus plicatilis]
MIEEGTAIEDNHDSSTTTSIVRRQTQDEDDDTDNDTEESTNRLRDESKIYDIFKNYDSLNECLEELDICSNCDKRLFILYHSTSLEVTVYIQDVEHNDEETNTKIQEKTKEKIFLDYCIKFNFPPRAPGTWRPDPDV